MLATPFGSRTSLVGSVIDKAIYQLDIMFFGFSGYLFSWIDKIKI